MNEHPNEIDIPTDVELTEPPRPRARAPRTLIALVGVAALLVVGAVFFAYDGTQSRDSAERDRRAATLAAGRQREQTDAAEADAHHAQTTAEEATRTLEIVNDAARQFGALDDQQLEAARAVQVAGVGLAPDEEYNAAVARSNAIRDLYVAAALDLIEQIQRLEAEVPA